MSGTAPTPSFQYAVLGGNATQNLQAVPLQQLNGAVAGVAAQVSYNVGRNFLHNPRFNVQQHGQGPWTVNGAYTADGWVLSVAPGDAISVSLQPLPAASVPTDESFAWFASCQVTGTSTATSLTAFSQRIENVRRMSNKTWTLSFWTWGTVANKVGVGYQQNFGSGGSPSAIVLANIGVTPAISTTTATRYSFTFNLPSAAGKTFGTTATSDYTQIDFWLSCPSANTAYYPASGNLGAQTGTFYFWGVQLEQGSTMTPLEARDPQVELALCQRFYQAAQMNIGGYAAAGPLVPTSVPLLVEMRVIPTLNYSGMAYTNCTALGSGSNSTAFWNPTLNVTALGNFLVNFIWSASAEY